MRRWLFLRFPFLLLVLVSVIFPEPPVRPAGVRTDSVHAVWVFPLRGPVTPPQAHYIHRWFRKVDESPPALVVLRIDTPGGLSRAMRSIIRDILASPVPVVGFVGPGGARAASAGTYILYACPLAAMAEGTNVGSATPIPIGGALPPLPSPTRPDQGSGRKIPAVSGDAETRKILNDAVANIRSLAEMNGRNADWAELAVRSAANLSASEALKQHVINVMAPDVSQLLKAINGIRYRFHGKQATLDVLPAQIRIFHRDPKDRWMEFLARPDLAYFFFLLGIAGLAIEFTHPGYVLPGVTGVISILLALYGLMILPVNLTGILLILLGISLMVAEVMVGAFGALGIAGVMSFFLGSLFFYRSSPEWSGMPSHPGYLLVVMLTLLVAGLFLGVFRMALKARFRPVVTGKAALIGERGIALETFRDKGRIKLHSEIWWATSPVTVTEGQEVKVEGISGLTLKVRPVSKEEIR
jgi:membrane-bound serine protease (ClpP class)|uniref:Nodulation protein NfeD n=1 Tax=Leptospirillum ferriphilum TaxID=178606 RepID=A0A7C3QS77_9BACT